MTHPENQPDDDVNDGLDEAGADEAGADDTDQDERPDPAPGSGEGGEGWRQQTGYGERVPDPDHGDHGIVERRWLFLAVELGVSGGVRW